MFGFSLRYGLVAEDAVPLEISLFIDLHLRDVLRIFRNLLGFIAVHFRCCRWLIDLHHVDVRAALNLVVHADGFLAVVHMEPVVQCVHALPCRLLSVVCFFVVFAG